MFWWNQSRYRHVVSVLPVTWISCFRCVSSRLLYSYRRRRRRGRVVCPRAQTVAFTVCLTLTLRTSQRAISVTLTISSMNRSAASTACSCSTSSTATSTGTSNTTLMKVTKCASSTSGKPPGNPKTTAPPSQADCLRWITRRYPSSFHQSEAVTWRTGWTNSTYASENNNKGRPGDNLSNTAHSQSATHPSNHPSNQVSDSQNVLQKKPMTPTDVDSPIKEEETPSTASEENKEPEEEVGNHFRYSLVFISGNKNVHLCHFLSNSKFMKLFISSHNFITENHSET